MLAAESPAGSSHRMLPNAQHLKPSNLQRKPCAEGRPASSQVRSKGSHVSISFEPHDIPTGKRCYCPCVQMRTLRPRGGQRFAQGDAPST